MLSIELEIERKAGTSSLNNAAAQNIVAVERLSAAHNRQAAGIDGGIIGIDIALVLRISAADLPMLDTPMATKSQSA